MSGNPRAFLSDTIRTKSLYIVYRIVPEKSRKMGVLTSIFQHSKYIKVRDNTMAYWLDTWKFKWSIEYEYKFAGRYGAKGEKRAAKVKATPEQIAKQNQTNRIARVRRKIKANFGENDLWVTLKYPKGTRLSTEQFILDLQNFLKRLRKEYRVRGEPFKWIMRKEIGKRGGLHAHLVVNRIPGADTDLLIRKAWGRKIDIQPMYEAGGYEDLAAYIAKEPDEGCMKQLSLFPEEERKKYKSYSCSKNLVTPVPERKTYRRWTIERLIRDGEIKATPGYYVDKNSIRYGINRYTGMSYLKYTEVKIAPVQREGG